MMSVEVYLKIYGFDYDSVSFTWFFEFGVAGEPQTVYAEVLFRVPILDEDETYYGSLDGELYQNSGETEAFLECVL